jgi:hypothetical protein
MSDVPTPALVEAITAYIRAGGYPHVAAEAAGVPRRVFQRWLRRGGRRQAPKELQDFRRAVLQAHAQARLKAEIAILDHKPLDWLRYGPGRETTTAPGWTSASKPCLQGPQEESNPLLDPRTQALIVIVLEGLNEFPEARARLAPKIHGILAGAPRQRARINAR